jgi:ribonuclease HI
MEKIFTDGSGDGRIAWYDETTGENFSADSTASTSNEAEYLAVKDALSKAKSKDVEIFSDSKLVVSQLKREWHIKEPRLRELFDDVQALIKQRGLKVAFTWIPREENPAGKYLG